MFPTPWGFKEIFIGITPVVWLNLLIANNYQSKVSVGFPRISCSCTFIIDDLNTTDNSRKYSLFILATVQ